MLVLRLATALSIALLATGCGSSDGDGDAPETRSDPRPAPALGSRDEQEKTPSEPKSETPVDLGFPGFATKNTTRVGGRDAVTRAAAVSLAVFPARSPETRPGAVALVDSGDWRAGISAAQLMARPLRVPLLFSDGDEIPRATESALDALSPTGATVRPAPKKGEKAPPKPQLLRIGGAPAVEDLRDQVLPGKDYAEQARAIDRLAIAASGRPSRSVIVAPAEEPAWAMPAAGYAAKSGTPVFWTRGATVPPATRAAIRDHGKPRIYLLGPESAIPEAAAKELAKLGRVKRITARDPIAGAVAFARYEDSGFGWNAVDPGHGFLFASAERPADAAAAAPLSASGSYAPLLLVSAPLRLDRAVEEHLLDVQPGYDKDPVRGVYNHGWLMGDAGTISVDVQSRIDALLEIQPVDQSSQPSN